MNWNTRYAKTREEALEQITKLHTLATSPSAQPGEASNAATMRDRLMHQHNISMDEVAGHQQRQQNSRPGGDANAGGFNSYRAPYYSDLGDFMSSMAREQHDTIRRQKINMGQADIGEYDPNSKPMKPREVEQHQKDYQDFFDRSGSTLRNHAPGSPGYAHALYWHLKRTPTSTSPNAAEEYRQSYGDSGIDWGTPTVVPGTQSKRWFRS